MEIFAEKVIGFYSTLEFEGKLPAGISIMNPFRSNPEIMKIVAQFYRKYYNDNNHRHIILGINPGRFGAGTTGIPFTDTKRLAEKCGLPVSGIETFETSSVFIYDMIDEFGGPEKFYSDFYISSVSPLGFTASGKNGKRVNYNYYDNKKLLEVLYDFIVRSIKYQLEFGIERNVCFCLGTGKNYKFLSQINSEQHFFDKIEPLEHPRYIMQYKSKRRKEYISKYVNEFTRTGS
jgi:hypothetical protein